MTNLRRFIFSLPVYLFVFGGCIILTVFSDRAITAMHETMPLAGRKCIVIDAGHGGEDGGAVSCTGILESTINLEIASRLKDLLDFLGYQTKMIRTEDVSLHTQGNSIAAHKVSDLKNRVKFVNAVESAILVSIHQNSFPEPKYAGPQVFYTSTYSGKDLAISMQRQLVCVLSPESKRTCKTASGIYLMDHIQCEGILIECGFLSNPEEEAKLRSSDYQKLLCSVISSVLANYVST